MLERAALWAIRRYVGGPARSWVFASLAVLGFRLARSTIGRRELVDIGTIKPGDQIVIEHLPISHQRQIREAKLERKAVKRAKREARRAARTAR